jgi:hypothetical protein
MSKLPVIPRQFLGYAIAGIVGGLAWALFSKYVLKDKL